MPIDTSIYQQPPSQGFNTPFQTLAQVGALQRQRQEIQSSQAEEQLRQQALKDKQQQDEANARFYKVIGNPDLTPDTFLAQVKTTAPEHYEAAQKMVDEARKNAADFAEKSATTKKANAEQALHEQAYQANQARLIKAGGDTPEGFEMAMKIHQEVFPDSKQPDEYRQMVLQQGPQAIPKITSALIAANAEASKQTAEQPEQEAKAKSAQLVLAGTSPTGMTANQQAEEAARQVAAKQGAQRIGLEAQRVALEKTKEANANDIGDVSQQVTTTASGRKYLDLSQYQTPKAKEAARAAAQKAGIFPVGKDVADGLRAADTARMNVNAMFSQIQAKLPTDPTGRVLAAPGTMLSKIFQTDEQKAAFDSWRSTAVQAIQSLSEKGMGLRLNQQEINLFLQNSLPRLTDTVGTAKQRIENFTTQLDNKEKNALTQDRSTATSSADLIWDPATKTFKKP
jgi:hypothetical protein